MAVTGGRLIRGGRAFTRHRTVRLRREREYPVPVAEAWELLSDTDRLNREIGWPPFDFSPPEGPESGFTRKGRALFFGAVPVRWREYPFDWVRERRYAVRREFEWGPVRDFVGGIELEPAGEGVRVIAFADFTARNLLGRLVAVQVGRQNLAEVMAYCDRHLLAAPGGGHTPATAGAPGPAPDRTSRDGAGGQGAAQRSTGVDEAALDRLLDQLRAAPVDVALIPRLRERIVEAPDAEVVRLRPYELADSWGADRLEVLRLFLHATRVGLLDLRWQLMCPTCRIPKEQVGTLAEMPDRFHCETCGIDYTSDFDRRVELRFSVHPRVRRAQDVVHCIGGPFRAPHVAAQQYLRAGESRRLDIAVSEALQLRAAGETERLTLVPTGSDGAGKELSVTYGGGRWRSQEDPALVEVPVPAGPLTVRLANPSSSPVVAVLERSTLDRQAATAAEVTTLQEFRDLFSSEVLAPGQEAGIESIAILFTDLRGSTSLYEGVGDAPAYARVNRHFAFLTERVARHRGSIVKTIGDAVMGVFTSIDDALEAAVAAQREIGPWCRAEGIEPPLVLRIGLHSGPVIAVNANGRLDYFGRTVNMAARVERQARGGDIVVLRDVLPPELIEQAVARSPIRLETLTAVLPGIRGERELVRLTPAPEGAVASSSELGSTAPASG